MTKYNFIIPKKKTSLNEFFIDNTDSETKKNKIINIIQTIILTIVFCIIIYFLNLIAYLSQGVN